MEEPQIRYAKTSDGVNIAWYAVGQGPPYIWPAGVTSVGTHWRIPETRETLEGIARRATLISYDPRGVGLSDRTAVDLSSDGMVRDLEAVADAATVDRVTIQTSGAGSIPAMAYAVRHPERVMALVLLNGIMRGADMSAGWERLVNIAADEWEHATLLIIRTNEAGFSLTKSMNQQRELFKETFSQESFLIFAEAMAGWDASELVRDVDAPALVTHYANAAHFPLDACRRLAASLPRGTFASITGDESQTVTDAATHTVRRFLREALRESPPTGTREPHSGTAVILFADIVDSTALTEGLGDAAFRGRARELDSRLRGIIRDHNGTPIEGKLLGDGVLATFSSARQAIEAALACGLAGDEGGLPLHLGLHAGDVIREEGNVYGGAVNIAARIAAASGSGELLVSQTVRDLARTSAGVTFEERGERELKGVSESLWVFRVRLRDETL